MAYSGKYKPRNPSKYKGDPTNIVYRSLWERHAFKWCDDNPEIKSWVSEEVVIPYLFDIDKRYHRYFVDLKITYKSGRTIIVEIKPDKETKPPKRPDKSKRYISEAMTYVKNMNKWRAAEQFAKDNGWEFQIWTEHTLEAMGIKPKDYKGLKPLKPLKPIKRKNPRKKT